MNRLAKLKQCPDLIIMAILFAVLMNTLICVIRTAEDPFCIASLTVMSIAALPVAGAAYLAWKGLRKPKAEEPDPYAALKNFPAHLEE